MNLGVFGNITSVIDLPDTLFWLFFGFFILLCIHNRRWDKREGYPLKASPFTTEQLLGWPAPPQEPYVYQLNEGGTTSAPHYYAPGPTSGAPLHQFDGTPISPIGNPLLSGLGPGAWVQKHDVPMLTETGEKLLQPKRNLPDWGLAKADAELRGMTVVDWRYNRVGTVFDYWIDGGIKIIRILEIELDATLGGARVLVPIYHTVIREKAREVRVTSLRADQFAAIPRPAKPDELTGQEDERLNAYCAAGKFYRDSPLVRAEHEVIWGMRT